MVAKKSVLTSSVRCYRAVCSYHSNQSWDALLNRIIKLKIANWIEVAFRFNDFSYLRLDFPSQALVQCAEFVEQTNITNQRKVETFPQMMRPSIVSYQEWVFETSWMWPCKKSQNQDHGSVTVTSTFHQRKTVPEARELLLNQTTSEILRQF